MRSGYQRFSQSDYRRPRAACKPAFPRDLVDFAHWLKQDEDYCMYDYQRESLLCRHPRKCHCDGRDVGKTTEIEILHLHFALTTPHAQALICAQWQNNLAPTLERLVWVAANHPGVKPFVRRTVRSPFYRIEFHNGSLLFGKIAGNRGVNFQNTHVDFISVDEAQNMLDCSWDELLPALNAGGRLHVYGVPNGVRNRFYQLSQDPSFAQFHWPSAKNKRFTPEKDAELQRLYGGADAEGYIHNVLGEHGTPSASAFDFVQVQACVAERDEPVVELYGEAGEPGKQLAPALAAVQGRVLIGADVGYTRDPTVFALWGELDTADGAGRLVSCALVQLQRVPYARQADVLAVLLQQTGAQAVACDRGGGGLALLQALLQHHPALAGCVVRGADGELGVPFNERVTQTCAGLSLRQPMKQATTAEYQRRLQERGIELGRSPRLEQMARQTYRTTERGDVVYTKGNDHILDADRCVMYYLLTRQQQGVRRHRIARLDEA